MSERPTLEQQLAQHRKRPPRTPQDAMQTTRSLINVLLSVWLLISCVLLVATVLGLVVLMRVVV